MLSQHESAITHVPNGDLPGKYQMIGGGGVNTGKLLTDIAQF